VVSQWQTKKEETRMKIRTVPIYTTIKTLKKIADAVKVKDDNLIKTE